ncbi:MAG: ABC transporter ATP-binding protein/permease [Chitinophagales bacterium]|jgi:ATP-binding cassette subfamily B protein|nr:ABC transporter ATP-binding protein/permease [Chitinophagales bacterium]
MSEFSDSYSASHINQGLVLRFLPYFKGYWSRLALAMFFLALVIYLRSVEPLVFQYFVDYLAHFNKTTEHYIGNLMRKFIDLTSTDVMKIAFHFGIFYVVATLVRVSSAAIYRYLIYEVIEMVLYRFRVHVFSHFQWADMSSYIQITKGEMIQRLSGDFETLRQALSNHIMESLSNSLLLFIVIFSIYGNYPFLAWISLAWVVLLFAISFVFFIYEAKVWEYHEIQSDKLVQIVQEYIQNIKTVFIFNYISQAFEKFNHQNQAKYSAGLSQNKLHSIYWPLTDFLILTMQLSAVIISVYGYFHGAISLGQLLANYSLVAMVSWPIRSLGRSLSQLGMAKIALKRLFEILDLPKEDMNSEGFAFENGAIEVRDLSFQYNKTKVLEKLNFHLPQGKRMAIIGRFSSGKTTLTKLMLGLYPISEGEIRIGNHAISQINKISLRAHIALMMQQSVLFHMSIRDNLSYASKETQIESMQQALEMARLDLSPFEQQWDTIVGERGVTLSGGQRQRMNIARGLLQNSSILILDDVSSALDSHTEQEVMENLLTQFPNKTMLVISNRLTTLDYVDYVLVLTQNGTQEFFGSVSDAKEHSTYLQNLIQVYDNSIQ